MKLKILYDHQTFLEQVYGGISRYYYELITKISQRNNFYVEHSILYSNNEYLRNDETFNIEAFYSINNFLNEKYFFGKNRLFNLFKKFKLVRDHSLEMEKFVKDRLLSGEIDIFHPTYYNPYYLEWAIKSNTPIVITVYDLIHEKFSDYFPNVNRFLERKKICIESANKVIAISENTKRDLVDYYKLPESKIEVIHLASSLNQIKNEKILREDFSDSILFVGNRSIYKNFQLFIKSIIPLFKEFPNLNIIVAGGGNISSSETKLLKESQIEDKIFFKSFHNDSELISLYRSCRLFVFPSIYEGFGIPIIESMQNGCPVVCSNTSSFLEVAGDAAFYFNPMEAESIFESVREVYKNYNLRQELIKKGFSRSQKFTWLSTIDQTLKCYKDLINSI
ncbi:glycosyltransferase family 1 protein [Leptospira bouyouniensis]|uniref:Glycosyltransferase family 1 protein n=1 Tax=Leptospira bouyouniensis TaxID=2484911 RepID=A0A7I0HQS5_9LEPT|nr:glycosyltransferase family 1 protein [Leptospira bouyouniensis]